MAWWAPGDQSRAVHHAESFAAASVGHEPGAVPYQACCSGGAGAGSCAARGVCGCAAYLFLLPSLGRASTNDGHVLCPGIHGLAVLGELSCRKGEGKYISLFLPRIHVDGFIMQIHDALVRPYMSCLILVINAVRNIRGFVESGVLVYGKTTFG